MLIELKVVGFRIVWEPPLTSGEVKPTTQNKLNILEAGVFPNEHTVVNDGNFVKLMN